MNNKYTMFKELDSNEIISFFTKKPFDFNALTNTTENIFNNYKIIESDFNYKFKKIIKPSQTHSSNISIVDENNINDNFENTDGLITNIKGVALVTSLADCQGIILYDKNKKVIGNIHSGWRGTLNKIVVKAVNILINKYNCNVNDIEAYIYPCIQKCCFEVDEDVKEKFINNFNDIKECIKIKKQNNNNQKYYIDTVLINKKELLKLGINKNNIHTSNECTKCNNNIYHSYRKEKENSGRNIAFIAMK